MKVVNFFLFAFVILISNEVISQNAIPKSSKEPPSGNRLKTGTDSAQYALGSFIAQWVNSNGFKIADPNLFIKGMDDVFQGKTPMISDSVVSAIVESYRKSSQKEKTIKQEQTLFASLKDKAGIGMFPNGVRYSIIQAGKGRRPLETDSILVHLIAKLPDGTVVENTYQSNKPFLVTPANFFLGLKESLQEMPLGSKWTLYVPNILAYGEKGTTLIPPYSALIVEIELLEIRTNKE